MYILVCISIVMTSKKFFDELDYDQEIKACNISKPYDALKSDFAKKILNNLSKKTKFKEWYIERIIEKLTDEEQEFTEEQRDDLFELMDQNQEFFDSIVERYKEQFPAWVQSSITNKSLDMQQEDHILYENGKYV